MWFYVVCLLLSLLSKASSLNCHSGAEIFSELFDLQLGNTTECFDEVANRCFRMDGELLFFGLVDANVSFGGCLDIGRCEMSCQESITSAVEAALDRSHLDVLLETGFTVSSCEKVCCDSDNCNENSIMEIRRLNELPSTTPLSVLETSSSTLSSTSFNTTTRSTSFSVPTVPIFIPNRSVGATLPAPAIPHTTTSGNEFVPPQCHDGIQASGGLLNINSWMSQECNATTYCLRIESVATVISLFNVSITGGMCARPNDCNPAACQALIESSLGAELSPQAGFPISAQDLQIISVCSTCQSACCDTDDCNTNTVEEIQQLAVSPATSAPFQSTTTTTIGDRVAPLLCEVGIESRGDIFPFSSWNITVCSTSLSSRCLKGEATLDVFGTEIPVAIGSCADTDICEEACTYIEQEAAASFVSSLLDGDGTLSGFPFTVGDCVAACCNSDNCNTESVSDIQRKQGTTTAPTNATDVPDTTSSFQPLEKSRVSQCTVGFQTISDIDAFDFSSLSAEECTEEGSQCFRGEATVDFFLFGDESPFGDVTLITGICANASTCMARCTNLTRQLVEAQESDTTNFYHTDASGDGGLFWLRFYEFTIRECDSICCANDDCNARSISEIRGSGTTTTASITSPGPVTTIHSTTDFEIPSTSTDPETTMPAITSRITTEEIAERSTTNMPQSRASQCTVGFQTISDIDAFDFSSLSVEECTEEGSQCFRGEATVDFFLFGDESPSGDVTLITGICANASTCMAQCTNLTRQLVEAQESDVPSHYYFYFNGASGDGGLFWLRFYEFTIRECDSICCANDDCNARSISEIRGSGTTTTASITSPGPVTTIHSTTDFEIPSTSTDPETTMPAITSRITTEEIAERSITNMPQGGTLNCFAGGSFESAFPLGPDKETRWESISCPAGATHCLRLEATADLNQLEGFDLTVDSTIGMCANASACEENCEAFFEKLLTEGEGNSFLFEIGQCEKVCCDWNNCNNNTVQDIRRMNRERVATIPPPEENDHIRLVFPLVIVTLLGLGALTAARIGRS